MSHASAKLWFESAGSWDAQHTTLERDQARTEFGFHYADDVEHLEVELGQARTWYLASFDSARAAEHENPASMMTGPGWQTARDKLSSAAAVTVRRGALKKNQAPQTKAKTRGVRAQEVIATLKKGGPLVPRMIGSPEDAVSTAREAIGNRANEVFFVLFVNIRNKAVGYVEFTEGNPVGVGVHPYGIFREAMLVNGAAFITAHQHPTGDPDPSAEDRALWERLREAGKILGIPCLDNLVLGDTRWYSESEGYSKAYP